MWPAVLTGFIVGLCVLGYLWRRSRLDWERRLAAKETALREAGAKLERVKAEALEREHLVFDSMSEGILLLDAQERIRVFNRALLRIFETETDLRGKTLLEAFRLEALTGLPKRVAREGRIAGIEFELGSVERRCVEVDGAAVAGSGQSGGLVLVFRDVTRVKQLENTRKEFVANVSHELRTPLSLIKGYVETLLDGAKEEPAVAARFLQTIQKNTDRLIYLIEDLLTISQFESGPPALNCQSTLLRPVAQRVLDDLHGLAEEKGMVLQNEVAAELTGWADSDRLQQVLLNLVDNAIKYGRAEGTVIVGGRLCGADDSVQVWVRDNGPGIPEQARERIFERFYRLDKARSREQGGTGLGLSIVKHIVQSHGGRVWVESVVGEGATFYFTLPVLPRKESGDVKNEMGSGCG